MRIARSSTLLFHGLTALVLAVGVAVISLRATALGPWPGMAVFLLVLGLGLRQALRRWRVAHAPFPERWRTWLEAHVPLYASLDEQAKRYFERDVQFFLDEHIFEGVKEVEVTDELRLGVAAGVALLLHGRPDWELPTGRTILLYPDRFDDDYYDSAYAEYDGMVHEQGPVLLSAQAIHESWADPGDGDNVVLHELAHLFDFKNAGPDGIPSLMDPSSEGAWQELMHREMRRIRLGRSMLRPYGATAPSEFFAVAVEAFFEQPEQMHRRHTELFEALAAFFNLDPRTGRSAAVPEQRA